MIRSQHCFEKFAKSNSQIRKRTLSRSLMQADNILVTGMTFRPYDNRLSLKFSFLFTQTSSLEIPQCVLIFVGKWTDAVSVTSKLTLFTNVAKVRVSPVN